MKLIFSCRYMKIRFLQVDTTTFGEHGPVYTDSCLNFQVFNRAISQNEFHWLP